MTVARTFVIGDIHGCPDEVCRLLDALVPTDTDTIIFLGDYIDRGPSPKAVVDRLLRLRHEGPRCVFLKGNHEDMFLAFLGFSGRYGEAFLFNGGESTLRSYGLTENRGNVLPPDHLEFFQSLQMTYSQGTFLCVHAGVIPTRPMGEQAEEDLLWVRDEFINRPHQLHCTVLFGHTPQREVFIDLPYKIGLDTGLVYWNKLSCLELEQRELFQIRRGDRTVQHRSLRQEFRQVQGAPSLE